MDNTATQADSKTSWKPLLGKARSVANGVFGVAALGVGGWFVAAAFVPVIAAFPLLMGGLAVAAGVDATWRSARELLPQKAQNFVSRLFTGKDAQPLKPPTLAGRAARIVTYGSVVGVGVFGFVLGAIGSALGGGLGSAALYFGGAVLTLGGFPKAISQAVQYVRQGVKENSGPYVEDAAPGPKQDIKQDLSPVAPLQKGGAEAAFRGATARAEDTPAPDAKPAPQPAAPAVQG
jgi:hypothetical protein